MNDRNLTEGEADVMEALWQCGEGTVREVLGALPADRPLAYTSIATWLKILETKGFVTSRADGRRLLYAPTLSRDSYVTGSVRRIADRWLGGQAGTVVRQLVDTALTPTELEELRRLVDDKLGGRR